MSVKGPFLARADQGKELRKILYERGANSLVDIEKANRFSQKLTSRGGRSAGRVAGGIRSGQCRVAWRSLRRGELPLRIR